VAKAIRQITLIHSGPQGTTSQVLFKKKTKRRKSSRLLKPLEKLQRRLLKAQKTFGDEAFSLHEKHNRKRKDGWLRDAPVIAIKASRRAAKKLTRW